MRFPAVEVVQVEDGQVPPGDRVDASGRAALPAGDGPLAQPPAPTRARERGRPHLRGEGAGQLPPARSDQRRALRRSDWGSRAARQGGQNPAVHCAGLTQEKAGPIDRASLQV